MKLSGLLIFTLKGYTRKLLGFLVLLYFLTSGTVGTLANDYLHLRIIEPDVIPFLFRVSTSQIGPHFNETFLSTSLVVTEPAHACGRITNKAELNRNIALIIRGGCTFVSKAINAHVAGAVAVIVYDYNRGADYTFRMIQDETPRKVQIPCAFMNGRDGHAITNVLDRNNLTKAIVDFPVNITQVPVYQFRFTSWTLW